MFVENNTEEYDNNSYSFFGPMGMAFYDDGNVLDNVYTVKLILSIYLGVVMALNLIGNICTCAVIARYRSMRTPTNCYLFNLAVTNLITAFFIPLDIYIIWIPDFYPLGEVGCRLHFLLWDFINNCCLLIIAAFTIERYLVIKKPFLRQKFASNSRVFKIVGAIWLLSCLFIIPDAFYIDLLERKKYVFCYFTVSYLTSFFVGLEIFVFSVTPMVTITVLYIMIVLELKSMKKKLQPNPTSVRQSRTKAVKLLAAVSGSFLLFWTPYTIYRLMTIIPWFGYESNYNVWRFLNYFLYISYISTVANPILYNLMSRKFRLAFKGLLKSRKSRPGMNTLTPHSITTMNSFEALKLTQFKLHHT